MAQEGNRGSIEERIKQAKLEDEDILNEIQVMVFQRASAARVNLTPLVLDLHTPVMSKIQSMRQFIHSLAPKFINMDYPYADTEWTEFPVQYSVDQIRRDDDHNLNVLPQALSCFDDDSVDLYRKFLGNVVYWLKKFRYISYQYSDIAYCNRSLKREWNWRQDWSPIDGTITYDAYENGEHVPDKTLAELVNGTSGTVYMDSAQQFTGGRSYTSATTSDHYQKTWDRLMRRNMPLYEGLIRTPQGSISNIPENAIIQNPTCYKAKARLYYLPGTHGSRTNHMEWLDEKMVVTDLDNGTVEVWGDNNQFSATRYSSTAGYEDNRRYVEHNSDWKEIWSVHSEGTTKRTIETNWSSDGERSVVISDETETIPFYCPSSNYHSETESHHPGFLGTTMQHPWYDAGPVSPYDKITIPVAATDNMPSLPMPTPTYVGEDKYVYGVSSDAMKWYYMQGVWCPVLDFEDYEIPEEPGE